jgi:hypothetical protein
MATTTLDTTPALAPHIRATLDALRSRIRAYIWAEGLTTAVIWLGFAFWLSLAVDWFFEPPVAVRMAILAAAAIGFVVICYRKIVSRLMVPLRDSSMAVVLERRFGALDDALLTAVLLTDQHLDPEKCNPAMLARTCGEAAERIGTVRVQDVFNPQPLQRSVGGAALFAASLAMFVLLAPDTFSLWARRSLLMSAELWPRQSKFLEVVGVRDGEEIRFADGLLKVARGAELTLLARTDTQSLRIPASIEIRYRAEGGPRQRRPMTREGQATTRDKYQQHSFRFEGVLAPIRFDLIDAGPSGDRLYDYRIEVVESPSLGEVSVDCEYPAYTGRGPRTLPATAVMQVPLGSRLTVRAKSNKPLARVRVDTVHGAEGGASEPVQAATLDEDGRGFSYALGELNDDTTLEFTLTDADGIRSRAPVRLVLAALADEPPQMRVRLDGIGTAITPAARVPLVGFISDDWGVARVWAETSLDEAEAEKHPLIALDKFPTEYEATDLAFEVRDLRLMPGQKLLFSAKAADRYDFHGQGPNVGQSERWLLEIVTPEQLRAMLEARELVLRQRFEVIINEVTETRDLLLKVTLNAVEERQGDDPTAKEPEDKKAVDKKADEKADAPTGAEPEDAPAEPEEALSPERHLALQTMRVQRALQNARKNSHETKGVAESFDDVRKQLVNNRIDTEELKLRIETGIARPLHAIADDMFPVLEQRLERLQAALNERETNPEHRRRAQRQADDILAAMLLVRDKMIELEDFNEAVEMLRTIIKLQEQLEDTTKQRHKQKIRDLMEDE